MARPSLASATAGAMVVDVTKAVSKELFSAWKNNVAYTVTITSDDVLYPDVRAWLTQLVGSRSRNLTTNTVSASAVGGEDEDGDPLEDYVGSIPRGHKTKLNMLYNEERRRFVRVDGHMVSVQLFVPEVKATRSSRNETPDRLEFTCLTREAQTAVTEQFKKLNDARSTKRTPNLKMTGRYGHWTTRSDLPQRPLESVAIDPEQRQRLVDDLAEFMAAEAHYNRLGIPWHRGYMFHGPAGTGKTSLARALASHFKMDLWYASLGDMKEESSLMGIISEVRPRSVLLLEDIDTVRITHDRDGGESGGVNMSSLLNALDGVTTPHGLITIMTTNHLDRLDPALKRAGRMDRIEHIDLPTYAAVGDLLRYFYDYSIGLPERWSSTEQLPIPMAAVSEACKRHLTDPAAAIYEIDSMIRETV